VRRFRYSLAPALDAARAAEQSAARAFVALRRASEAADAEVVALGARARAVVSHAVAHEPALRAPRRSVALLDRERFLAALALRRGRAVAAASRAARECDTARAELDARVRRRRAFEAHRAGALAAYRGVCDLADAAAYDESNACGREARSHAAGMHRV